MPRQEKTDPNLQRPSRREKDYGIYKLVNELSQQTPMQPYTEAPPDTVEFRGSGGDVNFGRSNITRTGDNLYSDLANLLDSGMKAGAAGIQGVRTAKGIKDRQDLEEMQGEIDALSPLLNPADRTREEQRIFETYEEKMRLVDAKAKLNSRINTYKKELPGLEDDQAALDMSAMLLEIDESEDSEVNKATRKLAVYSNLGPKLKLRKNRLAAQAASLKIKKQAGTLKFKTVADYFAQERNLILSSGFLDAEEQAKEYEAVIETYSDIFYDNFGDNPDLLREAQVLLSGEDVKASRLGESAEAEAERAEDAFLRETRAAAKAVVEEFNLAVQEGDLLASYFATDPVLFDDSTVEGRIAQFDHFLAFAKESNPNISWGIDKLRADADSLAFQEISTLVSKEGARYRGAIVRNDKVARTTQAQRNIKNDVDEVKRINLDPRRLTSTDSAIMEAESSAVSNLVEMRKAGALSQKVQNEAVDLIHTLASSHAASIVSGSQSDAFGVRMAYWGSLLIEEGFSPSETTAILDRVAARKFDPSINNPSLNPEDAAILESVYNEDDQIVNVAQLRRMYAEGEKLPWGERSLFYEELAVELTGMLDTTSSQLLGAGVRKLFSDMGIPEENIDGLLAGIRTSLATLWQSNETGLGDLVELFEITINNNPDLQAALPDGDDLSKLSQSLGEALFGNEFIQAAITLRSHFADDVNYTNEGFFPFDEASRAINVIEQELKDPDNVFSHTKDPRDVDIITLGIEQSPNEVALAAMQTRDDWFSYLDSNVPTNENPINPPRDAEIVSETLVNALAPTSPLYHALQLSTGRKRRDNSSYLLEHLAPTLSANARESLTNRFVLPLLNQDITGDDAKERVEQLKISLTGELTKEFFKRDPTLTLIPYAGDVEPPRAYVELEGFINRRVETGAGNNRSFGTNETAQFVDAVYSFLPYDIATSFLQFASQMDNNPSIKDLQTFLERNGKTMETDNPYVTWDGRDHNKLKPERLKVVDMYEEDDPAHQTNHMIMSFGYDAQNKPRVYGLDKRGKKKLDLYFKDLEDNARDPATRERIEIAKELYAIEFEPPSRPVYIKGRQGYLDTIDILDLGLEENDPEMLKLILPEDKHDLIPYLTAFFYSSGLNYRGAVALDQWIAGSNTALVPDMNQASSPTEIRDGELYFEVKDNRLESAGLNTRPTSLFYLGRSGNPFKKHVIRKKKERSSGGVRRITYANSKKSNSNIEWDVADITQSKPLFQKLGNSASSQRLSEAWGGLVDWYYSSPFYD